MTLKSILKDISTSNDKASYIKLAAMITFVTFIAICVYATITGKNVDNILDKLIEVFLIASGLRTTNYVNELWSNSKAKKSVEPQNPV